MHNLADKSVKIIARISTDKFLKNGLINTYTITTIPI